MARGVVVDVQMRSSSPDPSFLAQSDRNFPVRLRKPFSFTSFTVTLLRIPPMKRKRRQAIR
jgi:hypothetical protein